MKLKKKITALCAAILLLVTASLCAAMLWQVREQSYEALLQSTEKTLNDLVDDFGTAVTAVPLTALTRFPGKCC